MGLLRETMDFYKREKKIRKMKKQLLNAKTDFAMLELFVQKCNTNPGLKITITTGDGVKYELQTFDQRNKAYSVSSKINGDADSIDQMIEEYIQ